MKYWKMTLNKEPGIEQVYFTEKPSKTNASAALIVGNVVYIASKNEPFGLEEFDPVIVGIKKKEAEDAGLIFSKGED